MGRSCSMSASKKPHMNLVVTGHVDNGKSTTVGHLLVDLGAIDQRTIEQYAKESEATGKGDTFKIASRTNAKEVLLSISLSKSLKHQSISSR
jgi:translation elongation factor EF-1alpha